jgi:hypothetical protein
MMRDVEMTAPPVARPNPAADLAAWSRVTRRIHVWDYMVNFNNLLVPYPNWFVLGKVRPMQSSPRAAEQKLYRVGPNCGPTSGISWGFSVKVLGQVSQIGPTLYNFRLAAVAPLRAESCAQLVHH